MADIKITDLPPSSGANLTDIFEKVNNPSTVPISQKLSLTQIKTLLDTFYGPGTVTSVGLSMPTGFSVANSPITSSGTLAVTTTLSGILRGDGAGAIGVANGAQILAVIGTVPVGNGGTGLTTFGGTNQLLYTTATDTLSSIVTANTSALATSNAGVPSWISGSTANRLLRTDGTTISFAQAALATDVTGTLAVSNGGTGVATFGGTNQVLFTTVTDTLSAITTANSAALVTNSSGVPAWTSGAVANRVLRTNGTTLSFAQVDLSTDVTGTLGATNGSTGQTTVVTGDLLYGSAANTWSRLADIATGNALISGGIGVAPSWGKIQLNGTPTHIFGVLGTANGGTGVSSFGNSNTILFTTGISVLSSIAAAATSALVTNSSNVPSLTSGGTANRVLRTNGTTITFAQVDLSTDTTGTLAATSGGTGTATVTTGDILYGSASNVWSKLAGVATGNVLISGGVTTAPSWGKVNLTTHVSGVLPVANGGIPSGVILMWSGTIATIPSGFVLCNGANSTPDLRDKFIVCASADNAGAAKTTYPDGVTASQSDAGSYIPAAVSGVGTDFNIVDILPADTIGVPYFALAFIMKT